MLGRLIKYDLIKGINKFASVYIATIILATIVLLNMLSVGSGVLIVLGIILISIMVFVFIFKEIFYIEKELSSNKSYLTFTIPAKTWETIVSKIITFMVLSAIFSAIIITVFSCLFLIEASKLQATIDYVSYFGTDAMKVSIIAILDTIFYNLYIVMFIIFTEMLLKTKKLNGNINNAVKHIIKLVSYFTIAWIVATVGRAIPINILYANFDNSPFFQSYSAMSPSSDGHIYANLTLIIIQIAIFVAMFIGTIVICKKSKRI